jgi:hypothetical protein
MGAVRTKEAFIAEVAEGTEARRGKEKAREGPTIVGRIPAWPTPSGSMGTRPSEAHLDITYEGLCVPNATIMDLVVDDKVVVEAKAIERFSDGDFAQLNSCLHFANFEPGLLINFHAPR